MKTYLVGIHIGNSVIQYAVVLAENPRNALIKVDKHMQADAQRPNITVDDVVSIIEVMDPVTMIQ